MKLRSLCFFSLCSLLVASAQAALITVTATGRVVLLAQPFTTRFAEGQTFTYTFTYESTAAPITNQGTIRSIPLQSASLTINANPVWQSGPVSNAQLSINNGSGTQTDRINAGGAVNSPTVAGTGSFAGTYTPVTMGMELYAPSTFLTNTNVPTSFTLSDWNPYALVAGSNVYVFFSAPSGAQIRVNCEIQSLTSTGGPQPGAPEITSQPAARNASTGTSTAFTVTASGTGNTYQWRKDGNPIAGATAATLTLNNLAAIDAGVYTVVITNAAGTVTSANAALTVTTASTAGRLGNMSIRTNAGTGDNTLIVGLAVGGPGTSGTKPILIRGVGPTLTAFNLTGTLADPVMTVFQGSTQVDQNDDWTGSFNFTSVGAFAFAGTAPRDAAIYSASTSAGSYSIQIAGKNNGTGLALAEIYDATPSDNFAATTPRLVNVSARTQVGTGDNILIAGFAVSGSSAVRVLIRAVGPTLGVAPFNVGGTLADPKLEIYSGSTKTIENDNWAGTAELKAAFSAVAAFAFSADTSRDAALVATLQPGSYTAQISGVGSTSGVALVEIYELR